MRDIRETLTGEQQMSEAFLLSAVLALSGGFQDAYTYFIREHVYANAQTGNVVMMSTQMLAGEWGASTRYLFPLISFALGVLLAEYLHIQTQKSGRLHWRQYVIALEAIIMLAVGFMPQALNMAANCLVSLACAMQVQTFRTVHGFGYASTMCIGNLRSCMSALAMYIHDRDEICLLKVRYYLGVILCFAIGAGAGGNLCPLWGERSIWVCCGLLTFGYWLMGWKGRKRNHMKEIFEKYGW